MTCMSQRGLGKAVGLSQGNISDYETGLRRIDTMPAGKFVRILRALGGIDPSILLDQKEPVVKTEAGSRTGIEAEDYLRHADDAVNPSFARPTPVRRNSPTGTSRN